MAYIVKIKPSALKELGKLPEPFQSKVHQAILSLRNNPRPHRVRKLIQRDDVWRIRVGNYRVLFQIDDNARVVRVLDIKHRKEVYR